jgi:hypothetical protein
MPLWFTGGAPKELLANEFGAGLTAIAGVIVASGTVCTLLHSGHWALRPMASRVTCSFRPHAEH